tara:strand:+ start:7400 stop:7810 length:411 start_codon:yes stop_codon:yes gene_type:complete
MTINTANFGGDNALIRLAPDLLNLEQRLSSTAMYKRETVTMVAGVESAILTLTGKYAVAFLELRELVSESMTARMVVDGVEIWDSTITTGSAWALYNELSNQNFLPPFQAASTLTLYLTTTTDTSVEIYHSEVKLL